MKYPTFQRRDALGNENFILLCFIILIITGFAFNLAMFWPGITTFDSENQLHQAITNRYNNIFPPIMAWWWRWLMLHIWRQSGVLHLFHLIVFWAGIYFWGRALGSIATACTFFSLFIWLNPPIFAMTSVIWKDTGLGSCWLLATGIMTQHSLNRCNPGHKLGWSKTIVILLCLFYGTAVRHNALTALLPLCFWLVLCLKNNAKDAGRKNTAHWWIGVLASLVLFFTIVSTANMANERLTAIHRNIAHPLWYWDVQGLSLMTHTPLYPDFMMYRERLSPHYARHFPYNPTHCSFATVTNNPAELMALRSAYWSAITTYPIEYLALRWRIFEYLLHIREDFFSSVISAASPVPQDRYNNHFSNPTTMHVLGMQYMKGAAHGTWHKGYIYVLLSISMLLFGVAQAKINPKLMWPVIMLNATALMYILPYFFIAINIEYRYLWWGIVATTCSLLLLLSDIYAQRIRKENTWVTRQ